MSSLCGQHVLPSPVVPTFRFHVCAVAQSRPALCDPVNGSPPSSSAHGIFQARILEWVAISFSSGSSWPWGWTRISYIGGRFFTTEPWEPSLGYSFLVLLPKNLYSISHLLASLIVPCCWILLRTTSTNWEGFISNTLSNFYNFFNLWSTLPDEGYIYHPYILRGLRVCICVASINLINPF